MGKLICKGKVISGNPDIIDKVLAGNTKPVTSGAVSRALENFSVAVDVVEKNNMNAVTSNAVSEAIDKKQNKLTFDTTPTANSTNPVTSGGIKTALDAKVPTARTVNNHALSENISVTKSDIGLGSVVNTGDSATPVSGGTTKFTTGGAYTELAKKVNVDGSNGTAAGVSALLNKLETGTSTPVDNDYYISQYVNGGTTTTSYHRRPMSALYNYIKGKLDSVYLGKTAKAASATTADNIKAGGTAGQVLTSNGASTAPSWQDASGGVSSVNGQTGDVKITQVSSLGYTGTGISCFTTYQTSESFMDTTGWATYLIGNHGDGSSYYNQTIRLPFWGAPEYSRLQGGKRTPWYKFLTTENQPIYSDNITLDHTYSSFRYKLNGVDTPTPSVLSNTYLCNFHERIIDVFVINSIGDTHVSTYFQRYTLRGNGTYLFFVTVEGHNSDNISQLGLVNNTHLEDGVYLSVALPFCGTQAKVILCDKVDDVYVTPSSYYSENRQYDVINQMIKRVAFN